MTRMKRILAICAAAAVSFGAVAAPADAMTTMKMSKDHHMSMMHKGKMMHRKHGMMHHRKMMKHGM